MKFCDMLVSFLKSQKWTWLCMAVAVVVSIYALHIINIQSSHTKPNNNTRAILTRDLSQEFFSTIGILFQQGGTLLKWFLSNKRISDHFWKTGFSNVQIDKWSSFSRWWCCVSQRCWTVVSQLLLGFCHRCCRYFHGEFNGSDGGKEVQHSSEYTRGTSRSTKLSSWDCGWCRPGRSI